MAIYIDNTQYTTGADFFDAIAAVPNFWDSTTGGVLTKGDVSMTYNSTNGEITIEAGSLSTVVKTGSNVVYSFIAASEAGLVATSFTSNSTNSGSLAIGCSAGGVWGGVKGGYRAYEGVSAVVAVGLNDAAYNDGNLSVSTTSSQIVDLASTKGNFIFNDLRRVLYMPSSAKSYCGKFTMPNGEKYVKCDAFALRYTDTE